MEPTLRPRVKVCCIGGVDEAAAAVRLGASALGLVSEMPSGPGPIPEPLITEIAATVPPAVGTFLLTSRQDVPSIIDQQRRCRVNTIQIVDRLEQGTYDDLRAAVPGVALDQVIHVTGEEAVDAGSFHRPQDPLGDVVEEFSPPRAVQAGEVVGHLGSGVESWPMLLEKPATAGDLFEHP